MKKTEVIEGFRCVEFKARAQEALRRATEGMSPEQELRYLREVAARGKLADWFAQLPEMIQPATNEVRPGEPRSS